MRWLSHSTAYRQITIDLEYQNESPLRIGAGKGASITSPIDLPIVTILRNGKIEPYIPGSSIKGVFRSSCELLARNYGINVCSAGEGCKNKFQNELKEVIKLGGVESEILKILKKYCLICKIFGSSSYSSHVVFTDAYPSSEPIKGVKTGIAIDRRSGTVKRGALYNIEFIEPGSSFQGKIKTKNLPCYALGLLFEVIDLINTGFIRFGGFKSRGFGEMKVKIKNIEGYVVEDGKIVNLDQAKILKALDDEDQDVQFEDLSEIPSSCREVWIRYATSRGD